MPQYLSEALPTGEPIDWGAMSSEEMSRILWGVDTSQIIPSAGQCDSSVMIQSEQTPSDAELLKPYQYQDKKRD
ncbi:Protein sidekick [Frankliniella fusca]|uniref:Protein sidekick n=1 Tax=Frankliniella fusca TaxID=407009 RepID=A0AAE1I256_9NEOP|nr:Protein sidekick [Frankliniella fusca]